MAKETCDLSFHRGMKSTYLDEYASLSAPFSPPHPGTPKLGSNLLLFSSKQNDQMRSYLLVYKLFWHLREYSIFYYSA